MTRKSVALLALLGALPFPALAQGPWGVKASFDINAPGKWKIDDGSVDMYKSGIGFAAGALYSHYFNDNLYLEPSLSFFYDTYSTDVVIDESFTQVSQPGVYKFGLRLPVVLGYTFDLTDDFAVSVFTGPEVSYSFGGGYRIKDKLLKDELDARLFGSEWGTVSYTPLPDHET